MLMNFAYYAVIHSTKLSLFIGLMIVLLRTYYAQNIIMLGKAYHCSPPVGWCWSTQQCLPSNLQHGPQSLEGRGDKPRVSAGKIVLSVSEHILNSSSWRKWVGGWVSESWLSSDISDRNPNYTMFLKSMQRLLRHFLILIVLVWVWSIILDFSVLLLRGAWDWVQKGLSCHREWGNCHQLLSNQTTARQTWRTTTSEISKLIA